MMAITKSKSIMAVEQALLDAALSLDVRVLAASTRTAVDAATAIGCRVGQIVKSLLFKSVETGKPVLVLASGTNRVDETKISTMVGDKIIKADAAFTRESTGFAIGGVAPIGHKMKIPFVFIDEDLLHYDQLWAAAGTPHAVFSLAPADLIKLTNGKIMAVK